MCLRCLGSYENYVEGVQPSFGSVYECLSNEHESPDEAKAHRDSLTWQGLWDKLEYYWDHMICMLFSLITLMVPLAVLVSFCQSCMGPMGSFLETPFYFSSNISPYNSLGVDASWVSCLGIQVPQLSPTLGLEMT